VMLRSITSDGIKAQCMIIEEHTEKQQ